MQTTNQAPKRCPQCRGTGALGNRAGDVLRCPTCQGTGHATGAQPRDPDRRTAAQYNQRSEAEQAEVRRLIEKGF